MVTSLKKEAIFNMPFFLKRVGIVSVGTIVVQIINVISIPYLTRLYGPVEWGVFSTVASLVSIISAAGCLRYEIAIPLAKTKKETFYLMVICGIIAILLAALLFVSTKIIHFFSVFEINVIWENIEVVTGLLFVSLIGLPITNWLVKFMEFSKLSVMRIAQAIMMLFLKIIFASSGWLGLALATMIGQGLVLFYSLLVFIQPFRFKISKRNICKIAWGWREYPYNGTGAAIVHMMGTAGPLLFWGILFGREEAGYFALAMQIISQPVMFLSQSIGEVAFSSFSQEKDLAKMQAFLRRLIRGLFFAGIIIVVGMVGLAYIAPSVFGDKWICLREYLIIFAFAQFSRCISSPLSLILVAVHKLELLISWEYQFFSMTLFWAGISYLTNINSLNSLIIYMFINIFSYILLLHYILKSIRISWRSLI